MPAAPRGIEPEDVAGAQGVVGVAGREALRLGGIRMDPDRARTAARAAGASVGRDDVLHGADGETCVREIEVFAADAEPAAELAGAAGIRDQLETHDAGRELALDDL